MVEAAADAGSLISIHALREGRDGPTPQETNTRPITFNPRTPRGARPGNRVYNHKTIDISIHALREERDNPVA